MKKMLLIVISFYYSNTAFSQYVLDDIVNRVNKSQYVFEGEVICTNAYWNARHDYIYTSVTVDIKKTFKGNLQCGTVELILLGGRVGDEFLDISHNLVLSKGQKGIFLCQETRLEVSPIGFCPETNPIPLQVTENEQGFIKFNFDGINPEVIDYWQFRLDSLAQAYDLMELYTQLQYTDCYPPPSPFALPPPIDTIITVTLQNPVISTLNGNKAFEFDISLSDEINDIYFKNILIRFQYDTNVFIPRISNTNKIEATYQPLLSAPNTYFPVINLNVYSDNIVGINISSFQSSIPSFGGPYATLTTTPTPALHIKMEIEDCNLPDSVIPRTDIGINASRYTLNAMSDVTTFHYSDELSGSGVKFNGCGLKYISSISPTVVRAGVGDIVTITGLGFGVQGDSGNVFLKNADNGGAGFLHLDSIDYLDWTDTQIIFTVPSYVDSAQYNAAGATAGSGLVKIRTDSGYVINDSMTY